MTLATLILGATLEPGGLLMWLIVGLVAGFLASRVMRGGGYRLIGDIVVGVVGAFIGGWVADFLGLGNSYGMMIGIPVSAATARWATRPVIWKKGATPMTTSSLLSCAHSL